MLRRSRIWCFSLAAAALLLSAGPARAQDFGLRAGVSADPDQFYFGGHVDAGPIVERLHFRPNLEVGVGDDVTLVAINLEFVYRFPIRRQPWTFYAGGGPAVNIFDRDDDTDTEPGFNFLGGMMYRERLFFELKIGVIDSPEFKFGVGYTFK